MSAPTPISARLAGRCGTCNHFWPSGPEGSNAGRCHRYAPGRTDGLWPMTVNFEGCGEWQREESDAEPGHG